VKPAIDLTCGECGSNRLDIPAQADDDRAVVCEECGHALGTLAEVKSRVARAVLGGGAGERG
jgi:DNA-directed RNA polymerase subunit RPC12/RpoP